MSFPTTCYVECDTASGYVSRGVGNFTCDASTQSLSTLFSCDLHECLPLPSNLGTGIVSDTCTTSQVLNHGESCGVKCDQSQGYQSDSGTYECNHGGTATTSLTCSPHLCTLNSIPTTNNMEYATHDSCESITQLNAVNDPTCGVRCKYGFESLIDGIHQQNGTYECTTSSSFATTTLECTRVLCNSLASTPSDPTVEYESCTPSLRLYAANETCTTKCVAGYTGSGVYSCDPETRESVYVCLRTKGTFSS